MKNTNVNLVGLTAAALLLAACGGGGGTPLPLGDAAPGAVALSGLVTEKDGETTDLSGIVLTLVETGATAVTDEGGGFAFVSPPAGTLTLRVADPSVPAVPVQKNGADDTAPDDRGGQGADDPPDAGEDTPGGGTGQETETETEHGPETETEAEHGFESETEDEFEDDTDDRQQTSDDGVRVQDVQPGESVRIRLRIQDGRIVESRTSRSDADEREVEIRMARAATNDDPDLEGEVELSSRSDREKFEAEVDHAAPDRVLDLVVIDPQGLGESQGSRTVDALGHARWELDTGDGQRLPHGVAAVDDLAEHTVEVRDATSGLVLLTVTLGELPASAPPVDDGSSGDGAGGGASEDEEVRMLGRSRLVAREAGLEGYVEVRSRTAENRHRFKLEAEHLTPGRIVEFLVEDPGMPGTFLSLGLFAAGAGGEAKVELDTHDGDLLPGNLPTASALAGLAVQVRDGTSNTLLLDGLVPTPVLAD